MMKTMPIMKTSKTIEEETKLLIKNKIDSLETLKENEFVTP